LFSSFARGWPGAGLLLLRLVTGVTLIHFGIEGLRSADATNTTTLPLLAIGLGILVIAGLWTPIAGTLVTTLALSEIISHFGDPWIAALTGGIGAAMALLGPGFWSIDAWLFGWKRVDI
jgi:putative oxidoreductase